MLAQPAEPCGKLELRGTETEFLTRLMCQSSIWRAEREPSSNRRIGAFNCSTPPPGCLPDGATEHSGVSDIIARAGVARGTFYLYFESKHQIFLAVVSAFHDQVAEALDRMTDHPATSDRRPAALAADCTALAPTLRRSPRRRHRRAARGLVHRPALRAEPSGAPADRTGPLRRALQPPSGARARSHRASHPNSSPAFSSACSTSSINTYVLRETDADLDAIARTVSPPSSGTESAAERALQISN